MTRKLAMLSAGFVLMTAVVPVRAQSPPPAQGGEVAVIGCVELERDYRARKSSGRAASGVGVSNEFVLSNTRPVTRANQGKQETVSKAGGGSDYSLTGKMEKDFLRHVGRQVEVVGTLEDKDEGLQRLNVTLWHPVGDYCPSK